MNDENNKYLTREQKIALFRNVAEVVMGLYVLAVTIPVNFIMGWGQIEDKDLSGDIFFIVGFGGSILCVIIRFYFMYLNTDGGYGRFATILFGASVFGMVLIGTLLQCLSGLTDAALRVCQKFQWFMFFVVLYQDLFGKRRK